MAISDAKKRANAKYDAKTYTRISLVLKKEEKPIIQAHAQKTGESVNGFINRAIHEAIERDNQK